MTPRATTTTVIVHGPPGSGKSTLSRQLGSALALRVFDRDDFKDAMFETLGWSDRDWSTRVGAASWELLYLCIERLASTQISFIAESNFRPADALVRRLRDLCEAKSVRPVEIYCTASPDALWERFDARRRAGDRHAGHAGFETHESFVADLRLRPHGPLDLGAGVITLDTTASWPDVTNVTDRVREVVATQSAAR